MLAQSVLLDGLVGGFVIIPDGADDVLLLTWHGVPGDNRMWYSTRTAIASAPSGWDAPRPGGLGTGSPAVAQLGQLAYQGPPGSQQAHLFQTQYTPQGGIGGGLEPIAGPSGPFLSESRPALGGFYGDWPILAWRRQADGATAASFMQPNGWTSETAVGNTSHSPALSADGRILVWKGVDGDSRMWISERNGAGWGEQMQLRPTEGEMLTTEAPAVSWGRTIYRYVLAWRGTDDPGQIYWSTSPGNGWSAAIPATPKAGSMWTSHGPAVYQWSGGLTMVWKGSGGDARLWWSDYDVAAGRWEIPQVIAGANSDSGPSLGGVAELGV